MPTAAGYNIPVAAGGMELADVTDSKSVELITRVGSSPTTGTTESPKAPINQVFRAFLFPVFLCDYARTEQERTVS